MVCGLVDHEAGRGAGAGLARVVLSTVGTAVTRAIYEHVAVSIASLGFRAGDRLGIASAIPCLVSRDVEPGERREGSRRLRR